MVPVGAMVMPATSLSVVMTVVDAFSLPEKPPVLDAVAVRVVVMLPSVALSSTPVTVMVWGVSQLAAVKVSDEELSKTSEVSFPVMVTTTSSMGSASRTTEKDEEPPASVVRR